MTPDSPATPRTARRMPPVPPFDPVPVRTRRTRWSARRQAGFLGMLAESGSVGRACEAVGTNRKSSCALRVRPDAERFVAAWGTALGLPLRKVTPPARNIFCETQGPVCLALFRGRYRGSWRGREPYAAPKRAWAFSGGSGRQV